MPTKETKPQSVADFFSSIEQEQSTMFNPNTNSPTANYFQQQASINPFTQRQSMLLPQQTGGIAFQTQSTGFPSPNPFSLPQAPGFNPASAFISPQQPQQNAFLSPQPRIQPQTTGFLQPQPTGFLTPQATSSNPFRQSMFLPQATGLPNFRASPPPMSNHNPFPRPGSASAFIPGPSRSNTLPTLQEMPTGAGAPDAMGGLSTGGTNAFSPSPFQIPNTSSAFGSSIQRPASTPIKSSNTPMGGVVSHQTGSGKNSRNPFGNPAPPPVPPLPKAPTLQELASGVPSTTSPTRSSSGIPPLPTSPSGDGAFQLVLQAQPTGNGLIGSVASSFVSGAGTTSLPVPPLSASTSPFAALSIQNQNGLTTSSQSTPSSMSPPAFGASSAFSSTVGTASGTFRSASPPLTVPSITPLQSQPTGFAGSSVRPFKPSSSFGASLVHKLPTIQSEPTTPALTGAATAALLGSDGGSVAPASSSVPGLPSLAGLSLSPSPGGAGALNASPNQNQISNQASSQPFLFGPSSTLGSNISSSPGTGGSALSGHGLRPQPTGGAANPFRASMMFGGSGVPGGGTNASTGAFGSAFGGLGTNFPPATASPPEISASGAPGGNAAFSGGFGSFATQFGGSPFTGGSIQGTNNNQQQSLI